MNPDWQTGGFPRFAALWSRLQLVGSPVAAWNALVQRHAEPPRAYHNLGHVADCLTKLDAARHEAMNADTVETALWFHDAVYDSRAKDNEARSADFAADTLTTAGAVGSFIGEIRRLILVTRHDLPPANPDESLICDLDLSILAAPEPKFDAYERAIREEYAWVPPADFASGRSTVLRAFLARPALYRTPGLAAAWEHPARQNLIRSLARLQDD